MKTYDYIIRVSSMGDRREGDDSTDTIDDQRGRCAAWIEGKGGRHGREHVATDVSGWAAVDSPPYLAALERVRSGQAAGVVIAYSDRWSRNSRGGGHYFDLMEAAGAEIGFADHPDLDYRTPDGRSSTGFDGLMAERYYFACKERAESIARTNILRHGVGNMVPFGYRRNALAKGGEKVLPDRHEKVLVPEAGRADTVRRIFEMRADGWSWVKMSVALPIEGFPAPNGTGWHVSTLRSIVRNEAYLGVVRYERRNGRRGKLTGEVLRNEHAHEPLVARSLWQRAQSTQTVQRDGSRAAGLAGGLLRCGTCGGRLSVTGSGTGLSYGCRRQRNGGLCEHPMHVIKAAADSFVEREVLEAIRKLRMGEAANLDLEQLRTALDLAQARLENVQRAFGADDDAGALERLAELRRERDAARDAYERATEREVGGEIPAPDVWGELDLDGQRRVARELIDRIEVGRRARNIEDRFTVIER